jgi:hypothetical protein
MCPRPERSNSCNQRRQAGEARARIIPLSEHYLIRWASENYLPLQFVASAHSVEWRRSTGSGPERKPKGMANGKRGGKRPRITRIRGLFSPAYPSNPRSPRRSPSSPRDESVRLADRGEGGLSAVANFPGGQRPRPTGKVTRSLRCPEVVDFDETYTRAVIQSREQRGVKAGR